MSAALPAMARTQVPVWALGGGGVLLLVLAAAWAGPADFLRGYLPAWLFWTSLPLGCLAWRMIHGLTGGAWGRFAGPALSTAASLLPLNALLVLPLALNLPQLYPWAMPGWQPDHSGSGQAAYLQPVTFLAREWVLWLFWLLLAAVLGVWRQPWASADQPGRCALGLTGYGLGITVLAIDWSLSLEPRVFNANAGFLGAAESLLAGLAFTTVALCLAARRERWPGASTAPRFHDLGGLLTALLLLWAYLAFEQYLTVWSENLPDQAAWYLRRNEGFWRGWVWLMALLGGAVPFGLLLSRRLKRDPRRLVWAAGLILAGGFLNQAWKTLPAFPADPAWLGVAGCLDFIGLGGIWLAAFLWRWPRGWSAPATESGGLD
jgi:hypothetical protein